MPFPKLAPWLRFLAKVRVSQGGCWEWLACKDKDGYGIFMWSFKQKVPAHRASFQLHKGPIPNGMLVMHSCDNPPCVNPDHLVLGSTQDNVDDKMAKGRYRLKEN